MEERAQQYDDCEGKFLKETVLEFKWFIED